ncbi:putative transcription factor C2H2 family [Helianthus annuus]|nr:putative transcription factor C2H2 family [Helianthus annuus]
MIFLKIISYMCFWAFCDPVIFEEDNDEMMLEADESSPKNECKICLEKRDAWKMFKNPTCSHSFCYTTKHATTKMQEKHKNNACPGLNCTSTADINALRLSVSRDTLVEWYEFVYGSMIRESLKLYCPFSTCSVLLINDDTNISISKTDCPVCQRSFCATCRVPWHSEFRCKEDDEMVMSLAKKLRVVRI